MSRALTVALAGLGTCAGVVLPRPAPAHPLIAAANPAARYVAEPTPAAKLLEVSASAVGETIVLLCFIRLCAVAVGACHSPRSRAVVTAISWFLVIQGSQRLQGVMQSSKEVLNPGWYDSLKKPIWQPAPWVFPLVWIPLKMMQTVAASRLWAKLDYKSFSEPSIVLFMVHIALGDIWNRQFFLKQRLLTGLLVIYAFWAVVICTTVLFSLSSTLSASLLLPTVVWVGIAAALNLDVWWLNTVGN